MESHKRTLLKTITWRVVAILITFSVSFILTRRIDVSVAIGFSDTFLKLPAYYFHERGWNKVNFGRPKPARVDYQI